MKKTKPYCERKKNLKWVEQLKKAKKRYYEKNKEKLMKIDKLGYRRRMEDSEYREKRRGYRKAYYLRNKEKENRNGREYHQKNKNKERVRAVTYLYRKEILDFYDNKCIICGSQNRLQIHHTSYPEGVLTLNVLKSVTMVLCSLCHGKQHRKDSIPC